MVQNERDNLRQRSDTTFRAVGRSVLAASSSAAEAVRRWNDPREQLLRRRRRARRQFARFGVTSAATAVGTAAAAVGSLPEWTVLSGGGVTALLVVPAALGARRLSRLNKVPLPRAAERKNLLPGRQSAAFEPMSRLRGNEAGLRQIFDVLSRSDAVALDVVESAESTARDAAYALDAVSQDVVSMEQACASSTPTVAKHLQLSIATAVAQLNAGVDQYENLVEAAAKLTSPIRTAAVSALDLRSAELRSAADQLHGWASGLDEVSDITGRYT